tara:strand:+ start:648 stop:782 length:135 start_codon:yes stop_codon:yes gene_type:complete
MSILATIEGFFGTIFGLVVVFVGGALIGVPLWNHLKDKLPWNEK